MNILDGKALASETWQETQTMVDSFTAKTGRPPVLHIIQSGDHPPSDIYVKHKITVCEKVGIRTQLFRYGDDVSQAELLNRLTASNTDDGVDGIMVQLPLPEHIDSRAVLNSIHPDKDIDGLTPTTMGKLCMKQASFYACTPQGIMALLRHHDLNVMGKNAVVVGASTIVGRPMALTLLNAAATVTVCHSATKQIDEIIRQADVLVVAIGKRGVIRSEWIKPGAIVIDVGIHRLEDGTVTGDLDYESAQQVAGWITPVPGGVGPMTVAMVARNTVVAALERSEKA